MNQDLKFNQTNQNHLKYYMGNKALLKVNQVN